MLVVKLGGSLYNTPELRHWLTALTDYSKQQPIVIVPGGGPFADQVRTAQTLHHFDDSHAHHMALLGMAQFGILMSGIVPQCQLVRYSEINKSAMQPLSIWLPDDDLLAVRELKHSWSVTSDSLAIWLSQQLEADELIIIKHAENIPTSITHLVNDQILDTGFKDFHQALPISTRLMHVQDYDNFEQFQTKSCVIS